MNWFLNEWMATLGMRQVDLIRETGWTKTRVSLLCGGRQDYTPEIIETAARAMKIAPYELLLHPDSAMSIRRLHTDAVRIAADTTIPYLPEPSQLKPTGTDG